MGNGVTTTIDDIKSVIKELAEGHKKTEKILREIAKEHKKTEEVIQEVAKAQQKTEESQQKTEESLIELKESLQEANGNFNNKWGSFLENFIEGDLLKIFKKRNIEVNRIYPGHTIKREDNTIKAEYDFIIPNGEIVIVVEVKTTFSSHKLDTFVKKLKLFRRNVSNTKTIKFMGPSPTLRPIKYYSKRRKSMVFFAFRPPVGKAMSPLSKIPKTSFQHFINVRDKNGPLSFTSIHPHAQHPLIYHL